MYRVEWLIKLYNARHEQTGTVWREYTTRKGTELLMAESLYAHLIMNGCGARIVDVKTGEILKQEELPQWRAKNLRNL